MIHTYVNVLQYLLNQIVPGITYFIGARNIYSLSSLSFILSNEVNKTKMHIYTRKHKFFSPEYLHCQLTDSYKALTPETLSRNVT